MADIVSKLWTLIDLQIPLVTTDMETYLLKEGIFTQDDLNKFKEISKSIKRAYYALQRDPEDAIKTLKKALEELKTIQPKKPMPPEMKIRFEAIMRALVEATSSTGPK
jgi:hypothetical protein